MFRRKPTLYAILSRTTIWACVAGQCFQESSETPWTASKVLEIFEEQSKSVETPFKRVVLFLEFPWILTHFEHCVLLSVPEAPHYLSSHFDPLHLESENKVSEHLGAAFYESPHLNQQAVFSACLSFHSVELISSLETDWKLKVHWTPLLHLCFPAILKKSLQTAQESFLFQGLEQAFFIKIKEKTLNQITEIPQFPSSHRAFQEDSQGIQNFFSEAILAHTVAPERISLLETTKRKHSGDSSSANVENPKTLNAVLLSDFLRSWKGNAKNPSKGFWLSKNTSQKIGNRWMLAVLLGLLLGSGSLGLWELRSEIKALHSQVRHYQERVSQTSSAKSLVQEQLLMRHQKLKKLHSKLTKIPSLTQEALKKTLSTLKGVWLQEIRYSEHSLRLRLISISPQILATLLSQWEQMPRIEQAILRSQQQSNISGKKLILSEVILKLKQPE